MADPKWEETSDPVPSWDDTSHVEAGPISNAIGTTVNALSIPQKKGSQYDIGSDPEASSMLKTMGYLGGLGSTAILHSTPLGKLSKYLSGKTQNAGDITNEFKKALKGEATPLPEQLQKYAGLSPLAADVTGLPLSAAADPLTSSFSMRPNLGEWAENAAVKHLRPTPKLAQSLGPAKLRDIGREALDTEAVQFGGKAENTAANLVRNKLESGKLIEDYLSASKAKINPWDAADRFDKEVIQPLRGINNEQALVKELEAKRDSFLKFYGEQMTPKQINAEKGSVQDNINYQADAKPKQQSQMDWARILKEEEEKAMNSPGFNAAKRSYGNSTAAEIMSDKTAALTNGGTGLTGSLTDIGVNLEALRELVGGNPSMLPVALARGLTKGRTGSMTAVSLNNLNKMLNRLQQSGIGPSRALRQALINQENK